MNQSAGKAPLLPSILDRLIEPQGEETVDLHLRGQSVRELEEAVRRDLQDLLNTRRTELESYPDDSEIAHSLLTFGLPELTGFDPTVPAQRHNLQDIIERTIRQHEPRLMNARVASFSVDGTGRGLRLSVEALLKVAPAPLPVTFDTVIKSGSGEWQVVDSGGS